MDVLYLFELLINGCNSGLQNEGSQFQASSRFVEMLSWCGLGCGLVYVYAYYYRFWFWSLGAGSCG